MGILKLILELFFDIEHFQIDYEEVVVMEKQTRRKRSDASFVEEHRTLVRQVSRDQPHSAPRSIASSQSSGPKQVSK